MAKSKKEIKDIEVIEAEPVNVLSTIKASALIDVSSWKEKQLKLVAENTFFEIIDNKTYEAGKKCRTNVVKGRTELQNQDKLVASTFATIRKEVGSETAVLIEITQPLEDQWQVAVKAWEDRKAKEKEDAANAEAFRVKTINDKIDEIEASCYEVIQKMVFSEIEFSKTQLFAFFTVDFDFEEYDILFEQAKSRVETALENKVASLTASENQRLDNIRLEEESKELKRLSDLQAERLTAIMPYVAFGQNVDLTKLSELTKGEWEVIFDAKKALFDASVLENKKIEDERIAKEEEEKEAIYVIRRKRLLELGMQYSEEHDTFFIDEENEYILLKDDVCDYTAVEFEETFEEVKSVFKEANDKIEKEKAFEIRKGKLAEIGFDVETERSGFFIHPLLFDGIDADALLNLDEAWFESKITEAKLGIEKAKSDAKEALFENRKNTLISIGYVYDETQEYAFFMSEDWKCTKDVVEEIHESGWEEFVNDAVAHQKRLDEILSKEEAERLKNENKARIAKYASDKKALTEFVKSLEFRNAVPELQNEDMQPVLDKILLELENSRGFLLTEINLF